MSTSRLYSDLVDIGRETVRRLDRHPIGGELVLGRVSKPRYVHFLIQVVHQVCESGPFLERAGEELGRQGRPGLAALFEAKAGEEQGHHLWALEDLEALGVPAEVVWQTVPSSAVQSYNAWARHAAESAPIAIIGLAFLLEWLSYARATQAADNLVACSGIPNIGNAVRFLRAHGDADEGHIAGLAAVLGTITDRDEIELVLMSARLTATLYLGFFAEEPGAA